MKKIKVYGLKKCSTCISACNWLMAHSIEVDFIDYRDHPIPAEKLQEWAEQLGGWEKLVNRASLTWRNLPAQRQAVSTDQEWMTLIGEYPALIRRPTIVTVEGIVKTGFNAKRYTDCFG